MSSLGARRSIFAKSHFIPMQVAGCVGWFDGDDASTITIATGVSQWNDKSISGFNVTQAVGASQPSYLKNNLNGRNVLSFNGSQGLYNLSATLLRAVAGWTILAVAKEPTAGSAGAPNIVAIITADATGTGRALLTYNRTTAGAPGVSGRRGDADTVDKAEDTAAQTGWMVLAGIGDYTNTVATLYEGVNTTAVKTSWLTAGVSANDSGLLGIGANAVVGLTNPFTGTIAEVIIYNRALPLPELALVQKYLKAKWGL